MTQPSEPEALEDRFVDNALAGTDDGYYDHIEACGTIWLRMHRVRRTRASTSVESLSVVVLMDRFAGLWFRTPNRTRHRNRAQPGVPAAR